MYITATFIDEISHDIPHQNWGAKEWDTDFTHMKAMGINTVVLIRCGYRKQLAYPSAYLIEKLNCYRPSADLVSLFLELAEKHGMDFYFGLYDSGNWWDNGNAGDDTELNKHVVEEVWNKYGHYKAFKGWYLSMELSRRTRGAAEAIAAMGIHCKELSNGLSTFISPWIDGIKAVEASSSALYKTAAVSVSQHEREWNEMLETIKKGVDAVAFQDGHVALHELPQFLQLNKMLADKHGLHCWTNCESFDRDMPIKFLPIKFDKLLYKLNAAAAAGCEKAITFEFSHFMSPQSMYISAHHLYSRYMEFKTGNHHE